MNYENRNLQFYTFTEKKLSTVDDVSHIYYNARHKLCLE